VLGGNGLVFRLAKIKNTAIDSSRERFLVAVASFFFVQTLTVATRGEDHNPCQRIPR